MTFISNFIRSSVLALILTLLLFALEFSFPQLHVVNLKGRDFLFNLKHSISPIPPETKELALIVLDDKTLDFLQTRWPYPRTLYAKLLDQLKPLKPKAVGFDLVFTGEDFNEGSDEKFAAALSNMGNVVIAAHMNEQGSVGPTDLIRKSAWAVGIVDKLKDPDQVIRRAFPIKKIQGKTEVSWELQLLKKAFPKITQAYEKNNQIVINYQVKPNQFHQIPFWQAYEGELIPADIKDKIVLIGLTSITFHDIHATPFGSMPGLMVNANTLLTFLTGKTLSGVPFWLRGLVYFCVFWIMLTVSLGSSAVIGLLTIFFIILILCGGSFYLLLHQLVFDVALVCLALVLTMVGSLIYREGQLFLENLRLREESSRDPLTGFYSRRFMELKLKSELGRFTRGGFNPVKDVSVIMLDLDNFKMVNDSFGHGEGDRVLRTMAESIRSSVRKEEVICRYGGDEFCVILPNTDINDAAKFAEKLRQIIATNPDLAYRTASGVDTIRVTSSIGVAAITGAKAMESGGLLKAADRALYRAKQGGRNQVCIYDPTKDSE